jgi:hypothetical protein
MGPSCNLTLAFPRCSPAFGDSALNFLTVSLGTVKPDKGIHPKKAVLSSKSLGEAAVVRWTRSGHHFPLQALCVLPVSGVLPGSKIKMLPRAQQKNYTE